MTAINTHDMPSPNWKLALQVRQDTQPASLAVTEVPQPKPTSSSSASEGTRTSQATSLEEQLFDNAAQLKVDVSQIAMHLSPEWRRSIFRGLDALLSAEAWEEEESSLITENAFKTLLRFTVYAAPNKLPSLGVGPTGNPLAGWQNGEARVFVEFLSDDQANAILVRRTQRSKESASWRGHVADLSSFIQRFGNADCLG